MTSDTFWYGSETSWLNFIRDYVENVSILKVPKSLSDDLRGQIKIWLQMCQNPEDELSNIFFSFLDIQNKYILQEIKDDPFDKVTKDLIYEMEYKNLILDKKCKELENELDYHKRKFYFNSDIEELFTPMSWENITYPIIYFLQAHGTEYVKIGIASSRTRFTSISVGCPVPISLIGYINTSPGNKSKLERELHLRFEELRTSGEWFILRDPLIDYIKEVREKIESSAIKFEEQWEGE